MADLKGAAAAKAAALDGKACSFEEDTKDMKDMKDDSRDHRPGGFQDRLAALRKGLANGTSFFPDHFRPKTKGGDEYEYSLDGYCVSKKDTKDSASTCASSQDPFSPVSPVTPDFSIPDDVVWPSSVAKLLRLTKKSSSPKMNVKRK